MVATLPVIDAIHQQATVTVIALHPNSGKLLIGDVEGTIQCVDLVSLKPEMRIQLDSKVVGLEWCHNKIVILDETNGLYMYSSDGEELWRHEFEAGGAKLSVGKQILALDGIGSLRQFTLDGQEYPSVMRDVRTFEIGNDSVYLMMENQSVGRTDDELTVTYQRPQRGEIGEDIVALGQHIGEQWFVAREGHALVPGEEEALEIEIYEGNDLLGREEINGRVKASLSSETCHYLGLDNGELVSVQGSVPNVLKTFQYPIQSLQMYENTLLIGTWFYVYGFNIESKEVVWQIEHKGMIQDTRVDLDGRLVFFGDDQNDWTGVEPLGVCDLHQIPVEVDVSFLQLWFEEEVVEVETDPDIVYRTVNDFTNLLSEEEQESLQQHPEFDVGFDSLAAAMNEEVHSNDDDSEEQDLDELLQFLHEDAAEVIPPVAYAGENQVISTVEKAEYAIVTLDGSESKDPQDRIASWSWLDSTGRELSTEAKLRVKLSLGVHLFELRVFDIDGGMTTDSVQITIESSAS